MLGRNLHSKRRLLWIIGLLSIAILVGLAVLFISLFQKPVLAQETNLLPAVNLTEVGTGFARPLFVTHAGDGSGRVFIVEQAGKIYILGSDLSGIPFLDIEDRVLSPASGGGGEEGLLSLAFPPGYGDKGYFYVYYTMLNGDNVLSRFSLSGDPNIADSNSEEKILVLAHPDYSNHNGGQLAFGPNDGYLYIGLGDGGGGGDPLGNAQDPSSLKGKLLRIDVEMSSGNTGSGVGDYVYYYPVFFGSLSTKPYAIPVDNPFVENSDFRPEIWALGLRNPWRFSFDRSTGDLFIGDVGQGRWEEVNYQPASSSGGENYGWNIMEGEECYNAASCDTTGLTLPVHVYQIYSSDHCAVTGGYVYRGGDYPELGGVYIYGDFCSGDIWGLQKDGDQWQNEPLAATSYRISSFGEDEAGEIYLTDLAGGGVYKIIVP